MFVPELLRSQVSVPFQLTIFSFDSCLVLPQAHTHALPNFAKLQSYNR